MKTHYFILKTNRLTLHPFDDKDYIDVINMIKDPQINETYMLPTLVNKEEEMKMFNKLKNLTLDKNHYAYGIYLGNTAIGFINDVVINNDEIEVGYFISSKEWNKGYASESLKAVIEELFRIGFNKVIAGHFEKNTSSGKVMQKCGMTLIDKKETITYRNKSHNCVYYEIKRV